MIDEIKLNSLINIMTTKTYINIYSDDSKIFSGYTHAFLKSSIYEAVKDQNIFSLEAKNSKLCIYL